MSRPRIMFIVPGHQEGIDGVTDYTFWLAAAAGCAGVDCQVFALHPFQQSHAGYVARFPVDTAARLEVRVASTSTVSGRLTELAAFLDRVRPDWISFQFSPGMFRHDRFFLPGLLQLARVLSGRAPLCLTVHETARVLMADRTWRDRALGRLRRFEIETGLSRLRPRLVFASNSAFVADLARIGLAPRLLPVVSNIPVRTDAESHPSAGPPPDARVALFFARIPADWDARPALAALRRATEASPIQLCIVSVGETGHRDLGWRSVAAVADELGFLTRRLGPLPPEAVSAWLRRAEFGISPTPFALWQKSSSCAAMHAHGLPIVFSDAAPAGDQLWPTQFAVVTNGELRTFDAPAELRAPILSADDHWAAMGLFAPTESTSLQVEADNPDQITTLAPKP
jgi:hypothetical protein